MYPLSGVRLAFDLVQAQVLGLPVVIVHGACPSGVDDMAGRLAPEYGWVTEPHIADWSECSPLCEKLRPERQAKHRKCNSRGIEYCTMAGFWRNQQMVDLHKVQPYAVCLALPWRAWVRSPGTYDCFKRAVAAGIRTLPLDHEGHFFHDLSAGTGRRK